jgi:bla regulator protein blaR1
MTLWRHWITGQLDASIVAALLLMVAVLLRHRLSPSVRSIILLSAMLRLVLPPWLRAPWSEALVDIPPIDDGRMVIASVLQSDMAAMVAGFTSAVSMLLLLRVIWSFSMTEKRWLAATSAAPYGSIDGVEIRLSDANEGPLAVGLRRKLIVLPRSVTALDRAALDAVVAHELAHHRRHDLWWLAIAETARAIAWFNPLAHLIVRALVASREDGSDDWAVRKTSNDPFAYAQALLQSARMISSSHPIGVAGAHPMGTRLRRLLDARATREGRLGLAGWLVILVCAGAAVPAAHMPSIEQDNERIVIVIRR